VTDRMHVASTALCCPSMRFVVLLFFFFLVVCLGRSLSKQLPLLLMMWPKYLIFLAFTVTNNVLVTPAFFKTHSFLHLWSMTLLISVSGLSSRMLRFFIHLLSSVSSFHTNKFLANLCQCDNSVIKTVMRM